MMLVHSPGLLTTVQDLGRPGMRRFGVAAGGAADTFSHRIANWLVGNRAGAATLEVTLQGPVLEFLASSWVAVCGADLSLQVDGVPVPTWRPLWIERGSQLRFGAPRLGCRAYIAVRGGFDVPLRLQSRSTDLRLKLGGLHGRALGSGDVLLAGAVDSEPADFLQATRTVPGGTCETTLFGVSPQFWQSWLFPRRLHTMPGSHWTGLSAASRDQLWQGKFQVTAQSDRMGCRLLGPPLEWEHRVDLISSGVVQGTVQLPEGGEPILLLADGQTTGGYPRIAQIASADLAAAAQLKPGDSFQFHRVDVDTAETRILCQKHELNRLKYGIETWKWRDESANRRSEL